MLTLADNGVYRSTVAAIAAKQYPCLYKQGCVDGGWIWFCATVFYIYIYVCVYRARRDKSTGFMLLLKGPMNNFEG